MFLLLNLVLKYLLKKYIPKESTQKSTSSGFSKIDSLKNLKYGQSVTDACVGWKDTEVMLKLLAKAVETRRKKLKQTA